MDDKFGKFEGDEIPDTPADDAKQEKGVQLEKTIQHTPSEMLNAMTSAILIAVQNRVMSVEAGITTVELTRELIHWAFMKPGTHLTPGELLAQTIMMMPTKAEKTSGSKTDA